MRDVSGPHANQPLVTAGAPALAADVALVACHGRGATAQGIVNLLEPVYRHGLAVLAPQARRSNWIPRPPTAPREANEPALSSSVECVGVALEAARQIGIPPERTVLGGFSQGACVVAEFLRRRPRRYGGTFLLSGHLPGSGDDDRSLEGSLAGTPVLVGYGADDARIDHECVTETARVLERADADVDERRYAGVGHEVTDDEFDAIRGLIDDIARR
ncbi:alpha/beta hydrolase [Halopiger goleimassiliensis]|uniref:alpha/beta hydrolase n=1 Tax=Halopiger goleimassiliensis TaxID=1293048 RepID=UPI000677F107|nr:phospholipase [Halopiger goleimassiliensis]